MHGLSIPSALIALCLFIGTIAGLIFVVCRLLSRRADDGDQIADQIAHGDWPHMPIGSTPRPLINHEGE